MAKNVKVMKLLQTARGIVAKGWIQGALAEDKNGRKVAVNSDRAVGFCAIGALRRAEHKLGTTGIAAVARRTLRSVLPKKWNVGGSIMAFNDQATDKKTVLKLFDTAIAKVSK